MKKKSQWIKIEEPYDIPEGEEVIGYNPAWIDEDFNPNGTRVGFFTEVGFASAKWIDSQDCYGTCSEEGDDYDIFQEDGKDQMKTYWLKDGKDVLGSRPNLPTHFMLIPKHP